MESNKEDLERAIQLSLIVVNPNLNDTIPSLIEEEVEPERRSMVDLEEMNSFNVITPNPPQDETDARTLELKRKHMEVDDITPCFTPEEYEVAWILDHMQMYHDIIENLKKTHPNLYFKRRRVSSVKKCVTITHMEVDSSEVDIKAYTNRPRRFCVPDSYEVGECRNSVQKEDKKMYKKRKQIEEDDSQETLDIMRRWKDRTKNKNNPPKRMFVHESDALGIFSKPVRKQVTESDVKTDQCRLMLGKEQTKKMMEEVLGKVENPGTKGRKVSVYGPDGRIFEMWFKMWVNDTPVLTSTEWNNFVKQYGIESSCDFLTIWMFRHQRSDELCFAIDFDRLCVNAKLSNRILKEAGF